MVGSCRTVLTASLLVWPLLLLPWTPTPASRTVHAGRRLKAVIVVFDGLRPDYVSSARMPMLHAFAQRGSAATAHHSLFPTVTRVNASALATGAGPGQHGILDNTIFLPRVDSTRGLNTGDGSAMARADTVLGHRLLTVPTMPELLAAAARRVMVASAGSSGSAYLLAGAGRAATVNAEYTAPLSLQSLAQAVLGEAPPDASPNLGLNARAVDALLRIGVDSLDVDVAYLWLSDPDHTVHAAGIGSAIGDSSIRAADREFGRLLRGLQFRGLTGQVDVFVVSDHGFSTHAGRNVPITSVLAPFHDRVTVAGGAVYVRRGGDTTRAEVVRALQSSPAVGAIFTRAIQKQTAGTDGVEPGTLSFGSVGWNHARAGDVLFSANWSHEGNAAGFRGRTEQAGTAGHGTTSPYDITATLIAAGPNIRRASRSPVPSSNADVAPTVLHLLGVPVPPSMTGRVLHELLRTGPLPSVVPVIRNSVTTQVAASETRQGYHLTLYRSHVATASYVDSTITRRTARTIAAPR